MKQLKTLLIIAVGVAIGAYTSVYLSSPADHWRSLGDPSLAEASPSLKQGQEGGAKASSAPTYDLQAMKTLNRAVLHVEDSYVDPERVDHRKMVAAGLLEVQRVVPEVMVHIEEDEQKRPLSIEVQVNEHRQRFNVKELKSHYHLIFTLKDAFRFIEKHLKHFDDLREIEYATINGMLSTLDPHSVLLSPEANTEMRMNTQGHFGGLGIVIGVRDNHLTIINPIEDTPASRAGLQAGDNIVQIMLDSTVNMSLNDAVDLMRGEPGTQIDIHVMREGWTAPKKFTLTRAEIKVKSVKSLSLGDGYGVVRVRNFQSTTVEELKQALEQLGGVGKRGKLKGLILDLRGNPGGLLDQAAKMADLFIAEGTLVKTVGFGDKVREPKMATEEGTLRELPVAVLVDHSSASASEIVAGALKNHERAVIIGRRTFGKGSVQLLFDNPDQSALKLTIAQYLTPGDISIQSVGVTPSVELSPMLLTEEETYVFGSPDESYGEATLPEHLVSDKSEHSKLQKPLMSLRYMQDPELLKQARDEPNKIFVDFEIEFARDLLKGAKGQASLKRLLKSAEALLSAEQGEQEAALDEQLKARGVRWRSEVSEAKAKGEASFSLSPSEVINAGQALELKVEVKNTSEHPLHKLRAISSSENPLLKGHELLFGYIPPGESRSWTHTIKVSPSSQSRRDEMTLTFTAEGQGEVAPLTFPIEVKGAPRPLFALRYELDDSVKGDGDGLLEPGEEVAVHLSFKNTGAGESLELIGQLSNEGDGVVPALFIKQGRVQPEAQQLKPNEAGELRFVFKVKEDWKPSNTKVYLSLIDTKLRESSSELLTLPIQAANSELSTLNVTLSPKVGATLSLYPQPTEASFEVAKASHVKSEACLKLNPKQVACDWYRVKGERGWLWVNAQEVSANNAKSEPISASFSIAPPSIELEPTPHQVSAQELTLKGIARCAEGLEDVMIYVNNRKVFFLSKTEMSSRFEAPFEAKAPLEEGVNYITVYARHSEHRVGQEVIVVTTPKRDPQGDKAQP